MPRSSAGPSPPWAWRAGLADAAAVFAIFCGLLVWTGTARIPFWSIEGSDDAFFLEVARLWTRGVLPYAGAFDIKPPGYLAILAVAEMLFGAGLGTLKTVTIGFDAVAATALYCLGRRMGSRAIGAFACGLPGPTLAEPKPSGGDTATTNTVRTVAIAAGVVAVALTLRSFAR